MEVKIVVRKSPDPSSISGPATTPSAMRWISSGMPVPTTKQPPIAPVTTSQELRKMSRRRSGCATSTSRNSREPYTYIVPYTALNSGSTIRTMLISVTSMPVEEPDAW